MSDYITEVLAADVLLGRGSGPNDHPGNIQFRKLVAERKDEYMATNHRLTKARIAQEIVDSVFTNKGRFLRKLEGNELVANQIPEGVDAYALVSDEATIMEKAKQALRQNTIKCKDNNSPSAKYSAAQSMSPAPVSTHSSSKPAPDDFEPIPLSQSSGSRNSFPQSTTPYSTTGNHPQRRSQVLMPPPQSVLSNSFDDDPIPLNALQVQPDVVIQPIAYLDQPLQLASWQQQQPGGGFSTTDRTGTWRDEIGPAISSQSRMAPTWQNTQPLQPIDDDDSMLAMLPQSIKDNYNTKPVVALKADQSMSALPADDDLAQHNRRGSFTMMDLARAHNRRRSYNQSADMSDVMDSFSKMKTSDLNEQKKMFASTDTMGTIEGLADMSYATLNSSTFSIFRSDRFDDVDGTPPRTYSTASNNNSDATTTTRSNDGFGDRNAYVNTTLNSNSGANASLQAQQQEQFVIGSDGTRRRSITTPSNYHHGINEDAEYDYFTPMSQELTLDDNNAEDDEVVSNNNNNNNNNNPNEDLRRLHESALSVLKAPAFENMSMDFNASGLSKNSEFFQLAELPSVSNLNDDNL
jgi:hypothetical protein